MTFSEKLKAWCQSIKDRAWALWIEAAGVRATKTLGQTMLANLGTCATMTPGKWVAAMSASALAALVSIGMSFIGIPEVDGNGKPWGWLRAATWRCAKTMAQSAVGILGSYAYFSEVNWRMLVSSALIAGGLSIFTSLAGLPEVSTEVAVNDKEQGGDHHGSEEQEPEAPPQREAQHRAGGHRRGSAGGRRRP